MRITIEIPDSTSTAAVPSMTTTLTDSEPPRDGGAASDASGSTVAADTLVASAQDGGSYGGEVGSTMQDDAGAMDGGEASK